MNELMAAIDDYNEHRATCPDGDLPIEHHLAGCQRARELYDVIKDAAKNI